MTQGEDQGTVRSRMEAMIAAMKGSPPTAEPRSDQPPGDDDDRLADVVRRALGRPEASGDDDNGRGPPTTLAELDGAVLDDRYELGRMLGTGGMGAVFEGKDLRLGRAVAVKVMRPGYASDGRHVRRFLREAQAASKVRHRNVVVVLDHGEVAGGMVYSVMELLVGRDLEQWLRAQPEQRVPWSRARELLVQIASGLKAAHDQGVIHRDIKPANCFVTEEDGERVIKLVDFGIARLEGGPEHTGALTSTGSVLGTPSYVAPELVRTREPADVRSDVYSLGVLAYRMLTGHLPFTGATAFEVMRRACMEPASSLRSHVPELPEPVDALVREMMAKEPDQRPGDMQTIRQRLTAVADEDAMRAIPGAASGRPSRSAVTRWMLGLTTAAAVLVGAGWWLTETSAEGNEAARGQVTRAMGTPADDARPPAMTIDAAPDGGPSAGSEVVEREAPHDDAAPIMAPSAESVGPAPGGEVADLGEAATGDEASDASVASDGASDGTAERTPVAASSARRRRSSGAAATTVPTKERFESSMIRKIKKACAAELAGATVTVMFLVTKDGRPQSVTASPRNEAGECAKQQVEGSRFPVPDAEGAQKIVVE